MRLRLNLFDVDMQLKIKYKKYDVDDFYEWSETELNLHSHYINYDIDSEILMISEVQDLCHTLEALVDGTMKTDSSMRFVEPDLELKFYVAKRLYSNSKVIYTKGYCDVDICLELFINFWCSGGLGSNQFKMVLSRYEIEAFVTYLKVVIGELQENDPRVLNYMRKGLILPE